MTAGRLAPDGYIPTPTPRVGNQDDFPLLVYPMAWYEARAGTEYVNGGISLIARNRCPTLMVG